ASLICMMPRAKSNDKTIVKRKSAVETRTSTTNWSDRFINAEEFPDIKAVDPMRFKLPPVPVLNERQLKNRLVPLPTVSG
ncbi:MAG: hypothetical protein ACI831_001892, partial [Candidatus Azotimanducaceae bacterium]